MKNYQQLEASFSDRQIQSAAKYMFKVPALNVFKDNFVVFVINHQWSCGSVHVKSPAQAATRHHDSQEIDANACKNDTQCFTELDSNPGDQIMFCTLLCCAAQEANPLGLNKG